MVLKAFISVKSRTFLVKAIAGVTSKASGGMRQTVGGAQVVFSPYRNDVQDKVSDGIIGGESNHPGHIFNSGISNRKRAVD